MENEAQSMDLPEEDPAIFHFIIAFLYEDRYVPIKPAAQALRMCYPVPHPRAREES